MACKNNKKPPENQAVFVMRSERRPMSCRASALAHFSRPKDGRKCRIGLSLQISIHCHHQQVSCSVLP